MRKKNCPVCGHEYNDVELHIKEMATLGGIIHLIYVLEHGYGIPSTEKHSIEEWYEIARSKGIKIDLYSTERSEI